MKEYDLDRQQGMTLIELMIALLIGTFLLAGIMQIFVGSQQNYRVQDSLSRMQENGRFAIEFISRSVRMADFKNCYSEASVGGEVFGSNDLGLNGSDRITVIQKDDDCAVAPNANTFSATAFFILADISGQPALFRVLANSSTVPLTITAINNAVGAATANQAFIEGIENMQILYGEDTDADGTANHYLDSASIVDMDEVVSVRISLLVRSIEDNLTLQPRTYSYMGADVTPVDRRLRRVFTTTISLRNRL